MCRASPRPIADEPEKEHQMKNIMTAGLAMAALSAWPAPATSHDKQPPRNLVGRRARQSQNALAHH
jgi:hypothetical protein